MKRIRTKEVITINTLTDLEIELAKAVQELNTSWMLFGSNSDPKTAQALITTRRVQIQELEKILKKFD